MGLKSLFFKISDLFVRIKVSTATINEIMLEIHRKKRNIDPRSLNNYEYQAFSQNGEDGIISEIFRRIGTTNKYFVEFGVGDGLENNSTLLLLKEWRGLWIEANPADFEKIQDKFNFLVQKHILSIENSFITPENIENIFEKFHVPYEFDLLAIDIDGNDYWVWKSIIHYSPRVLIIEYNSIIPPDIEWIMKYQKGHIWNKSSYFGASLKSLEKLGMSKGYLLIGCDFKGVNAFFLRKDLVNDQFLAPFTADNHYECPKYYLNTNKPGHFRDFGEFVKD